MDRCCLISPWSSGIKESNLFSLTDITTVKDRHRQPEPQIKPQTLKKKKSFSSRCSSRILNLESAFILGVPWRIFLTFAISPLTESSHAERTANDILRLFRVTRVVIEIGNQYSLLPDFIHSVQVLLGLEYYGT